MKVKKIIKENFDFCSPEEKLSGIAGIMKKNDDDAVPVVSSDGNIVGIITARDICFALAGGIAKFKSCKAENIMTTEIIGCSVNDRAETALNLMRKHQQNYLAVTDKNGKFAGILSITDIMLSVRKNKKLKKNIYKTLEAVSQPRPITLQEISDQ